MLSLPANRDFHQRINDGESVSGPPISSFTYFFKLHSISDLIISTLTGIRKTFEDLYFKDNFLVLILFIAELLAND